MTDLQGQSSDKDLLLAAQAGSIRAFEALVERHIGMIYAVAYGRTGLRETAEDLAQEVFLRAYLALGSLKECERFCVWLRRIAHNLIIDWQRREKISGLLAMVPISQTDMIESVPDMSEEDPRERMHQRQHEEAVRKAIFKLPSEQREIVLLHYAEELNQREIARRLEIHPATVGRHLKKGLAALKNTLEPIARESSAALQNLRVKPRLAARTALVIGSTAALSTQEKLALASAAGNFAQTSAESLSAPTLFKAIAAFYVSVKLLATNKAALVVAALIIALGSGALYVQRSVSPNIIEGKDSEATINGMPVNVFNYFKKLHESMSTLPDTQDRFVIKTIMYDVESPEKIIGGFAAGFRNKEARAISREVLFAQGDSPDVSFLLSQGGALARVKPRVVDRNRSQVGHRYDYYVTLPKPLEPGKISDNYSNFQRPPLTPDAAGIYHLDAGAQLDAGDNLQCVIMLPEGCVFASHTEEPAIREQFENRQVLIWRKPSDGKLWKFQAAFKQQD